MCASCELTDENSSSRQTEFLEPEGNCQLLKTLYNGFSYTEATERCSNG
jgi:hypothetical protein